MLSPGISTKTIMAQQEDSENRALEGQHPMPCQLDDVKTFYEQELKRKDELIRKLSKIQPPTDERGSTEPQDSIASPDKIERLKVKMRHLNQTIEENRVKLQEHQERIHDLTIENECLSIENLELSAQKDTVERDLRNAQERLREYAAVQNRNEVAILALQEEINSKQENVCELMDRLNKLNCNTSDKMFSQENEIQNHQKGLQTIASVLACNASYEACSEEIKELIQKKTTLEGQVSRLRDTLASSEFEQRAARETTLRLSGELNREVNARDSAQSEVKETQKELEATKGLLERSEATARLLRDRIQTLTEALDKAHSDFDKRETELRRLATLNGCVPIPVHPGSPNNLSLSPRLAKRYEEEYNHFQEFLRFGQYYLKKDTDVPSAVILRELKSRLVSLEAELGKTQMAFTKCQGDTGQAQLAINGRDSRILQLEESVERMRNELADVSVVNEALKKDKCSLNSFLMKVADHLKLDELSAEAEIPLLMDAVFTRLRQLMTGEGERTAGQRVKIVRLQQKLREVTDRNESLELQVNILRRRLSEQEDPRATSPRRPATSLTNADRQRRRFTKQVEQMRAEILSLQAENLQLKAQALTENKNSLAAIGKAKVLHAAETRARELQNRCERQAEELESLRRKLASAETSASEEKQARNEQFNSVTTQLTAYRTALDAARKTEKQLLDFRSAVAKTVGLDCERLTIPDVEIICQLEQIMGTTS